MKRTLLWLVLGLLLVFPLSLQGKTYTWVDKDGTTHFSNKPPAGTPRGTPEKEAPAKAPVQAPATTPARQAAEAPQGDGRLFLWTATSPSAVLHLLGSIHVARPGLYPLDRRIEQAFEDSAAIVVEADVTANEANTQTLALKLGTYPPGDSLERHLTARTLDKARAMNLNLTLFNPMRPWYAAMLLQVQQLETLGYSTSSGIDHHFLEKAKTRRMPVRELESTAQQLQLFADISRDNEDLYFYYSLLEMDNLGSQIDKLFEYWRRGDTESMERLVFAELNKYPEFKHVGDMLFTQRNIRMAAKLDGYLKESTRLFVIVGAGHLVGPDGIVTLLRDKGYRVEQVGS